MIITAQATARRVRRTWPWLGIFTLTVLAVVCPLLFGGYTANFAQALQQPTLLHPFGTDHAGYDLGVRTAESMRMSLTIAVSCSVAATVFGVVVAVAAVTFGGVVDAVVMRSVDAVNAMPHLIVGVVIAAMWRGDPTAIVVSIAATHWPSVARTVRAELVSHRAAGWIEAAQLAGASSTHIGIRHLLPSATRQAAVAITVLLPHAVWHETTLSFLGVGLSPDRASLGSLLGQARGDILLGAWWTLLVPGLAVVIAALLFAAAASALRKQRTLPTTKVW